MSDLVAELFEQELRRRGVQCRFDEDELRYRVQHQGRELLVSLDNLARNYAREQDVACVASFVDNLLSLYRRVEGQSWEEVRGLILFAIEPSDYAEPLPLRSPISDRVDRVPVIVRAPLQTVSFITPTIVDTWQVSRAEVETTASRNLAAALTAAKLEYGDVDGVRLGYLGTELPIKAALILAPNLREVVSPVLGWPLYAVIPDRDFLYLWASRHQSLIDRVGRTVVKEFATAPYPITTEVFEISDDGIRPIGAYSPESA
jgi:uncharacterized protein YtpQ (UPF0354 family)